MQNKTLTRDKDALESKVTSLLYDFVAEVETLENKVDELENKIDTLEAALASATSQISELQKQINDAN